MRRERKEKQFKGETDSTGGRAYSTGTLESSAVELRGRVEQHREGEGGSFTGRVLQRQIEENKLNTDKDRRSKRMRRSPKIRTDC